MLRDTRIEVRSDTMVLEITPDRRVHTVSRADGYRVLEAKAVILAMGCRERTRGAGWRSPAPARRAYSRRVRHSAI